MSSTPRLLVGTGAIVCRDAIIEGSFDVQIEKGCIIHPKSSIRAINGPIIIGENTIVEELVSIVNTDKTPMKIGTSNLLEVGCVITTTQIGDENVIGMKAHVPHAIVGNRCRISIGAIVPPHHTISNGESMFGQKGSKQAVGIGSAEMHQITHGQHLHILRQTLPNFHALQATRALWVRVKPPQYLRRPHKYSIHGCTIKDEYAWLQDSNDPKVQSLMDDELRYAEAMMEDTKQLQNELYQELVEKLPVEETTCGEELDGYEYFLRVPEGQNFPVYCRRQLPNGTAQVLVDQNTEGQGFPYINVLSLKVSLDNKLLGYSRDVTGDDTFDLVIKNINTNTRLNVIPNIGGFDWAAEHVIFYSKRDDKRRPYQVYRHRVGDDHRNDVLLLEESNDAFFVDINRTKDKAYIVISSNSKAATSVRVIPTDQPFIDPVVIHPLQYHNECYLDHRHDEFILVKKKEGSEFSLHSIKEDKAMEFARTLKGNSVNNMKKEYSAIRDSGESLPTNPISAYVGNEKPTYEKEEGGEEKGENTSKRVHVSIQDIDVFADHMVTYERVGGLPRVRVLHFPSQRLHTVSLPEDVCTVHPGGNMEFNTNKFRFSISSPVSPEKVYDYNMDTRELSMIHQEIYPGYNKQQYQCKRVSVPSFDGADVPLTIVSRKGLHRDSNNPTLMLGYGAYGQSVEPEFEAKYGPLMDRGWMIATAHVRGGGELGSNWYQQGRRLNKMNSFHDFIACTEYLVDQKYTRAEIMGSQGSSAGGLLVAGAINMRPDLYKAAILSVPFVDTLTSMLDSSLPLTIHEYDEWGDPTSDKEVFEYMKRYDPYYNLSLAKENASSWPAILLSGSVLDDRVPFWHPLKYAARIRSLTNSTQSSNSNNDIEDNKDNATSNSVLLKMSRTTGHSGEGGKYSSQLRTAFEWAFLMKHITPEIFY